MKRVIALTFAGTVLLLLSVVGFGGPDADAQIPDDQTPGHAVDINENGDVAIAVVKESGRLFTRTYIDDAWTAWRRHGRDTWTSADVAIDDDGNIALAGQKQGGQLWTRAYSPDDGWENWVRQGFANWSTESVPAIDIDKGTATLAAVKDFGALLTRTREGDADWSSWTRHGLNTWVNADITVSDGAAVFVGTKDDGRVFSRTIMPEIGDFVQHVGATFSIESAPSISLHLDTLALGVIDDADQAFVRTGILDRTPEDAPVQDWDIFGSPVETSAAAISVSAAADRISFAHTGTSGELTKSGLKGAPGAWEPISRPVFLGFSNWSASVSPSIAAAQREGDTDALIALEADGSLFFLFEDTEGERLYDSLGVSNWASGLDTREDPVERTEYPSGLYVVGAEALPADIYQIDAPGDCAWVRFSSMDSSSFLDNQAGSSLDPTSTQSVIGISSSDGAFQLIDLGGAGCGTLSPYEAPASLVSPITEGTYVVGGDIEPGRYVSDTACDWERLGNFAGVPGSVLSYDVGVFDGPQIIDVLPTDVGLKITGNCEFSFRVPPATPASQVGSGMHVVRSDIASGRYVVTAGCSFARLDGFTGRSRITDEYLDLIGGFPDSVSPAEGGDWVVDIAPTDIGFLLGSVDGRTCQATTFVDPVTPATVPSAGSNVVGSDFEPGIYLAPGGAGCFWMRLSDFDWTSTGVIAGNPDQDNAVLVTVLETDVGFHASSFCGSWTPFESGGIASLKAGTALGGAELLAQVIDDFAAVAVD